MKQVLAFCTLFICILLVAGCSKESEETAPVAGQKTLYTLSYTAAANGTIDGVATQRVSPGETGSAVSAVPAVGYSFAGWSDGENSATRTDANPTADLVVTAKFSVNHYPLVYTAGENGTIDGSLNQTVAHAGSGSPVTAVPATGYYFTGWSDGSTSNPRTDANLTAALRVTATFARKQYTLSYVAGANGSIEGRQTQLVNSRDSGTPVTAVPAEHHHFAGWSDGIVTAGRTDANVKRDIEATANFESDQYSLTYSAEENGSIEGATSQTVAYGGSGEAVTAVPAVGYHFVGWSDGVKTENRTESKVSADLAVTASFAINRYSLKYTAGENGTLDGIGQQSVDHGGDANAVKAVAQPGYHFVNWSDGITSAERVDAKVKGDLEVKAVFAINTYRIGGNLTGLVAGTTLVLQNNGGDDLALTTNGDFSFATELLNASSYKVGVLTQPTSPNQTCSVTRGTGTLDTENVKDVQVSCILNTYVIGGVVSGLAEGDQVVLRNNAVDELVLSTNGAFVFATELNDGSAYEVKVHGKLNRPNWTCSVENAAGILMGSDVSDVIVDCYPEVILQATAGMRKIKLSWNAQDFNPSEVTFNLCRAQEEIPLDGFGRCQDLKAAAFQAKVNNPLALTKLVNDIPLWLQLEAHYANGRQTLSKVVKAVPFGGLNDSGIDWCADALTNHFRDGTKSEKSSGCEALAADFPGQDAFGGRDALARNRKLAKTGSGAAGFDFTKICQSGQAAGEGKCSPNPLPGNGLHNWACNRDNVTGLIWEVKSDTGLRGKENTYSWDNSKTTAKDGAGGVRNGGKCEGSACDTHAYVQAVNEKRLCGITDWRLPTKRELLSIVDNSRFKPAVDTRYFPNTLPASYWSSSTYPDQENSAWQVYFLYGEAYPIEKKQSNPVRLVHGRTGTFGLNNP